MILIFPILTFFAGKMTSKSWRANFAFSIMGLCRFLNDPIIQISKLKKLMKYVYALKRYNGFKFEFNYLK